MIIVVVTSGSRVDEVTSAFRIETNGVRRLDERGQTAVSGERAAVVLVNGIDQSSVASRVVAEVSRDDDAALLLHCEPEEPFTPPPENQDRWKSLHDGAVFYRSTDADGIVLHRFLQELGSEVTAQEWEGFTKRLRLLQGAIAAAAAHDDPRSTLQAIVARLKDAQVRSDCGLAPWRGPAPANPIATIIHDVVNWFEPLVMELETAASDAEHWERVRERYQPNILERWRRLGVAFGSEQGTPGDQEWLEKRQMKALSQVTADIARRATAARDVSLEAYMAAGATAALGPGKLAAAMCQLVSGVAAGALTAVSPEQARTARHWIDEVRGHLDTLDRLYREVVLGREVDLFADVAKPGTSE